MRQQLSERNSRFDDLLDQIKQQPDQGEEDATRAKEMFTALLSGQHAMLEKFSALTEDRNIEGHQLVAAADALQLARQAAEKDRNLVRQKDDLIHALRQQLAEVKVTSRYVVAERDELRSAASAKGAEDKLAKQELESLRERLAMSERDREAAEGKLYIAQASLGAAEKERDAIAGALGEAHGYREDIEREMVDLQHQVSAHKAIPTCRQGPHSSHPARARAQQASCPRCGASDRRVSPSR